MVEWVISSSGVDFKRSKYKGCDGSVEDQREGGGHLSGVTCRRWRTSSRCYM